MKIKIGQKDITHLLTSCTWSGSRLNVARKLEYSFVQDDRLDAVEAGCTTLHKVDETTSGGDDDLYTTAKRAYLRLDGRASVDGEDAYRG